MGWYMDLAERLHMTLGQLLDNTTSEELALWMARDREKAQQQKLDNLLARAEAAGRSRGRM